MNDESEHPSPHQPPSEFSQASTTPGLAAEAQPRRPRVWTVFAALILAIVLVLFGAKRLRNIGGDLGGAIKGFRKAMKEDESRAGSEGKLEDQGSGNVIDGEVTSKKQDKV